MLHISFSNLLLLTVSRSSMYLIVSLNFLAHACVLMGDEGSRLPETTSRMHTSM